MKKYLSILVLMLLFLTSSVAQGNYTEIQNQLEDAEDAIKQMEEANVPTKRVDSLLITANRSFRAQKNLAQEQDIEPDFSRTKELVNRIIELKQTALRVKDQINSLEERINKLEKENLNLTDTKEAFEELNQTFQNQRFEEAESKVENVYSAISEAQSVQTQVQAFASAQQQNIIQTIEDAVQFAKKNWLKLSIATIISSILLYLGQREYRIKRLEARREKMINKKEVIEEMIHDAQREYYVKGEGSKTTFNTRIDKFEEMKRETEQEINDIEAKLDEFKTGPLIESELIQKAEEFHNEGDVIDKNKLREEAKERSNEEMKEILQNESVKEAKEDIEDLDNPDYRKLLEIERNNKDRKTLKDYLKDQIKVNLEKVEPSEEQKEMLASNSVSDAKEEIKELEDPDYSSLLKAEMNGKNRKTMKDYLKERMSFDN